MEVAFKHKVTEALNNWLAESPDNRTLNGLAEEHSITKLYVSKIKNGVYAIDHNGGKVTEIADEYFYRIAYAIGLTTKSGTGLHWETANFKRMRSACKQAQGKRMRLLIEAMTGFGKTYTLEHFSIHTDRTIYIKVTKSMTERNILDAILKKIAIYDPIRGNREKLNAIKHKLTGTPGYLLILDEVEYARKPLFHVFKEIADFLEGKCGFILSGCGVISLINKWAGKNINGFPQLKRRFFPNRLLLPTEIAPGEITQICEDSGITDKTAKNVILQFCKDFDMLSQVIVDCIAWQDSNRKKISGQEVMARFKDSFDV